jgi:hypothetical protein
MYTKKYLPRYVCRYSYAYSEDSCKRIENHKDFDLANKHNDDISLMEIVRLTHITLPATKIAQLAAEEDKLDNLKQIQNESENVST